MTNELRIDKERVAVSVATVTGGTVSGEMFLQAYARHRSGPEEPADVLNDGDAFFPLSVSEYDTLLLAKDHVLTVDTRDSLSDGHDDIANIGARPVLIEVTMVGGVVRIGQIFLEVPVDRPRLLDFLNRFASRFLPLHTSDGVSLVNRRMIERVRPLD